VNLLRPIKHLTSLLFFAGCLSAQKNLAGESEIRQSLADLSTTGSVMMIAAHPDDENTALLAYFARGRHMRTAYLSLTRGEGGQNLIGSEQGAALGVIRTQELLAARKIDGAEQYFTRAIDFGFSKTAADTFAHWPREKVLGDIVWEIRRFRPDVIILRFSGTPADGHGQHQVSAILGKEAFSVAADPAKFPEQLQWVKPWQAKRLMYNVLAFTADQEREAQKLSDKIVIDVGDYNPELGYSYAEIAGQSRSQHRSQGMGAPEQKGSIKNYLVTIAGDKATHDVFDGIDTSWKRYPDGAAIQSELDRAEQNFRPDQPETSLKPLIAARPLIASSSEDKSSEYKLKQLDETIALCAGLWLGAASDHYSVVPGGSLKVNFTVLARRPERVVLNAIDLSGVDSAPSLNLAKIVLAENQPNRYTSLVHMPEDQPYSQPYWLVEPADGWLYRVPDPRQIGDPENPPLLESHFHLKIDGADLDLTRPAAYSYVDHIYGETVRPLAVVPRVAVNFNGPAQVFPNINTRRIEVPIKANVAHVAGDVHLEAPEGWRVDPPSQHFDLAALDQQTSAIFQVTPPTPDSQGELHAVAMVGDRRIAVATEVIAYPHIPTQTLFPRADRKLLRAEIQLSAKSIGYVMGAGDEIPGALSQMGAQVTLLSAEDLSNGDLSRFDAIVTGIRAFNTRADLRANVDRIFDYVQNGGVMLVQYNVLEGGPFGGDPSLLEHIGPYPMTISRDRVTDPNAPVALPNPENPLLRTPNQITEKDFSGWVQERGLNFASQWDPKYQTVLESHDPGEEPHPGGELYARYGKGVYIFSAYSWFRELPAGVAGAYRLFANMVSAR
jgi:LmbE family N-acetylglucosaminyl deacetylase